MTAVNFGVGHTIISGTWTEIRAVIVTDALSYQYAESGGKYTIFAPTDGVIYTCEIWTGTVPSSIIASGYSQSQNDTDKTDFESNFQPYANMPVKQGQFNDPRIIRRLGNLTATSTSEVVVCVRGYTEQSSEAQRSVKSSNNQDNPGGSGAGVVRIVYLDSSYVQHYEDVTLNGTSRVSTTATDIRFIEDFFVVQGAAAAGAISLLETASGPQNEFAGISSGTTDAFLCHHYVPAGKQAWVLRWHATVDDQTNFKLWGQKRVDGTNLVDRILDLDNLVDAAATPPVRLAFERSFLGVTLPEKTYVRVTAVPQQSTSTVIRAGLEIWEIPS